jgi:hypothetical protein
MTQIIIWRMRITCWIPKATDTHTEYVTLVAFPRQQWLHKWASLSGQYGYGLSCTKPINCLLDRAMHPTATIVHYLRI